MTTIKPREFYVQTGAHDGEFDLKNPFYQTCIELTDFNEKDDEFYKKEIIKKCIHVVEHSAYQAALDEIEALKAKVAELEKSEDDLAKLNCDLEDKCAKYEDALKLFTQVHFMYSFKETEFEIHTEPRMISNMARQALGEK